MKGWRWRRREKCREEFCSNLRPGGESFGAGCAVGREAPDWGREGRECQGQGCNGKRQMPRRSPAGPCSGAKQGSGARRPIAVAGSIVCIYSIRKFAHRKGVNETAAACLCRPPSNLLSLSYLPANAKESSRGGLLSSSPLSESSSAGSKKSIYRPSSNVNLRRGGRGLPRYSSVWGEVYIHPRPFPSCSISPPLFLDPPRCGIYPEPARPVQYL